MSRAIPSKLAALERHQAFWNPWHLCEQHQASWALGPCWTGVVWMACPSGAPTWQVVDEEDFNSEEAASPGAVSCLHSALAWHHSIPFYPIPLPSGHHSARCQPPSWNVVQRRSIVYLYIPNRYDPLRVHRVQRSTGQNFTAQVYFLTWPVKEAKVFAGMIDGP